MTSLGKTGLCTEVTSIALLGGEEASSWDDSQTLRKDGSPLCSWEVGGASSKRWDSPFILIDKETLPRKNINMQTPSPVPSGTPQFSFQA